MRHFTYGLTIRSNSLSTSACAQHAALIAHGLLGEVDIDWTQNIGNAGITMAFEKAEHVALFATRWQSLTEADWYRSLVYGHEGNQQKTLTPSSPRHECEIVLSGDLYRREEQRIRDDYTELGLPHAENGDYAEAAVSALLNKVVRLVAHLDIDDFGIERLDDLGAEYEESDPLAERVRLTFSSRSDMDLFLHTIKRLGWCPTGSMG